MKPKAKEIKPRNNNDLLHGYQEWYYRSEITLRGTYKHGDEVGYEEYHITKETKYYIR